MSSDDRQKNEDFNLEIDSAVETFFSRYEDNAPKMHLSSHEHESDTISEEITAPEIDDSSHEPEFDITSEEESALEMEDSSHEPEPDTTSEVENTLEMDDSSLAPVFAMLSDVEDTPEADDSPNELEQGTASEEENVAPEKPKIGSGLRAENKSDPTTTHIFNSLTEAILTVDWEVNDANVNKVRKILEEIMTSFPALKESRAQEVVDGMLTTLDAMAASPLRVPTSAIAQLEKAIPILRGIASGAQMEDGYHELIEDAIAGLEACRAIDNSAEGGKTDSPDLMSDNGDGEASKTERLEPIAVPVGASRALCNHSTVVAQLTPRAKRLSDLYAAAQGSEKVQAVLQKICGLLELQTRALQDAFSLNCDIAIFPIGKINNLSDFLDFQLMAMGACSRHARVLEKTFKKHPNHKRFRQSIYFLRIAMERQIDELSRTARGDDASVQETESMVPVPPPL